MDSNPTPQDKLTTAVKNLHVSESTTTNENPWSDDLPESTSSITESNLRLKTPDPASYDPAITGGFGSGSESGREKQEERAGPDPDVLNEFDPLAGSEEKAAQEAWASTESHPPPPPPPRTPSPATPPPPEKDETPSSSTQNNQPPSTPSSTTLNSLTSFARSFSIPALTKSRPTSMDGASNVPSPATLSSFASQQQQTPRRTLQDLSAEPSSSDNVAAVGTASPKDTAVDPPFDFQKFLDQMKSKNAEPIAKYLKSFLSSFTKRTFTVNDQVKIVNDFLAFIAAKMREVDVWRNASDAEFENAMEGIEKLVMNRVYEYTFTPAVVSLIPPRPVTADDLERDRVLSQRVALFHWLEPKHLDIPEGEGSQGFLMFAQQELLKINHYKAPRDKLICILNCCKVIFGLIRHLRKDEGADSFVPILIFVVLKANPDNLLSNVEFINRFRNPAKLQGESGYYLSSLMGAVSFVETMDHTSLSCISQQDFESNVEHAIQSLPISQPHSPDPSTPRRPSSSAGRPSSGATQYISHAGEESAEPLSMSTPVQTLGEDARKLLQDTISKPLNAIGRIFSEALDGAEGKLSYLPGPFAPMELGREARQERGEQNPPHVPPLLPMWGEQQRLSSFFGGSYPGSAPSSPGRVPQTPMGGEGLPPIQTPYKPRIRRTPSPGYLAQTLPGSAGYSPGGQYGQGGQGYLDETPSRPGQLHTSSLSLSALPPAFRQPIPQSASQPLNLNPHAQPGSAHISRTPTPSLDFVGMQTEIDQAHEQVAEAARGDRKSVV